MTLMAAMMSSRYVTSMLARRASCSTGCTRVSSQTSQRCFAAAATAAASSSSVELETVDNIAVLSFDDGKMNSFSFKVIDEWNAALDDAKDADALAILGNPKAFSAGFDLKVMGQGPCEEAGKLLQAGGELVLRLAAFKRPVVIGAEGHTLALGAFINLVGDYRIGTTDNKNAMVGMTEVKIGMPVPQFGMELARWRLNNTFLTRTTLLSQSYSPSEAAEAGFFEELVPTCDIKDAAVRNRRTLYF